MTTKQPEGMMDRLVGMVPENVQREVGRLARAVRNRLPPVVIEHRIDALERRVDKRFKDLEAKIDEILTRVSSRAA